MGKLLLLAGTSAAAYITGLTSNPRSVLSKKSGLVTLGLVGAAVYLIAKKVK